MQSKTDSGITGKARERLARILKYVLREECFLLEATRDYRGSVTGPNRYSLHRLFDEQRRQLDYWLDRVIERTSSAGLKKRDVSAETNVRNNLERCGAGLPARSLIGDLLQRHEHIAQRLRDDIGRLHDPATADFLLGLVEFHETTAWMLRVVNEGSDPAAV